MFLFWGGDGAILSPQPSTPKESWSKKSNLYKLPLVGPRKPPASHPLPKFRSPLHDIASLLHFLSHSAPYGSLCYYHTKSDAFGCQYSLLQHLVQCAAAIFSYSCLPGCVYRLRIPCFSESWPQCHGKSCALSLSSDLASSGNSPCAFELGLALGGFR